MSGQRFPAAEQPRRWRLQEFLPDPGRGWIRWQPASWPGPEEGWMDLAGETLREGGRPPVGELPQLEDVLTLPPVAAPRRAWRDALLAEARAAGTPVLVGRLPGEEPAGGAALEVYDLSGVLLPGSPGSGSEPGLAELELPAACWALWPWIAGISDRTEVVEAGLDHLASLGVAGVLACSPRLTPAQRRRLAEYDPGAFADLFHGTAAPLRPFHVALARRGLSFLPPRPLPPAGRRRENRALAAGLYQVADLWRRLEEEPVLREELVAAARHIDRSEHAVADLARADELGIVPWIGRQARPWVVAAARGEREPFAAVERRYLGPAAP